VRTIAAQTWPASSKVRAGQPWARARVQVLRALDLGAQ
jgi:hypothetical protein